jgi:hypothetical protein
MADALVTVDSAWVGELGAVSLVDLPAEALDRFHRDLMEQAFSPEELLPRRFGAATGVPRG